MSLARAIALAAELDRRNYYEILGVPPDCGGDEIDRRYYEIAPRLHPDRFVRHANSDELRAMTRISARLTEARNVLSSPRRRALYDAGLTRGEMRLVGEQETEPEDTRDPRTPVARKLFAAANALIEGDKLRQAMAKLRLAIGFEADSAALASAIADLEAKLQPTRRSKPGTEPPIVPEPPPAARRFARIPLSTKVAMRLADWKEVEDMFTRNLSLGGVFLRSSKMLPIGSSVSLSFALPDGTSFELPGQVARCVEPGGDEEPGIGIQFLEMPEATRNHIEELLERTAPAPPPPLPDIAAGEELTLEAAVTELLRLRACPPREALALAVEVELNREQIEQAYARESSKLAGKMLTAGDPNLITAIAEGAAHLSYARDLLLEDLETAAVPAVIHDAAPQPAPEPDSGVVALEIHTGEETRPRRLPKQLLARPVLAPRSLADLGPRGVAASDDSTLADRIFMLIAEGHYEAAIELIAKLVPNEAPPRLIAARHIARGYIAETGGDLDRARVEFESALVIDRTSCEAILRLRKKVP